jgi:hypothetical protein
MIRVFIYDQSVTAAEMNGVRGVNTMDRIARSLGVHTERNVSKGLYDALVCLYGNKYVGFFLFCWLRSYHCWSFLVMAWLL